jgi:Flp pilus assembly pilin Flp
MQHTRRFLSDERGLETVEYAIIAGLVVSGLVAVIVAIGEWTKGRYTALGQVLRGA